MKFVNEKESSHTQHIDYPVTDVEAARILGLAVQTLRNYRCQRRGPNYLKIGKNVRYRIEDLEKFKNENLISL